MTTIRHYQGVDVAIEEPPPRPYFPYPRVTAMPKEVVKIARSLTKTDNIVLWYIMLEIRHHNVLRATHEMIAAKARLNRSRVTDAFNKLVELGVLRKQCNGLYEVNPNFIWRGSSADYNLAKAAWDADLSIAEQLSNPESQHTP